MCQPNCVRCRIFNKNLVKRKKEEAAVPIPKMPAEDERPREKPKKKKKKKKQPKQEIVNLPETEGSS